jgi:hypothetical protein
VTAHGTFARRRLPPWLWLLAFTAVVAVALYFDHRPYGEWILKQSRGVATGHAEWRVYQNRILGPFLIAFTAGALKVDYGVAFGIFVFGSIFAANLVAYYTLAAGGRYRTEALRYCALLDAGFLVLQVRPFLYEWDCIDLVVFHLLVLGAITGRSIGLFLVVFLLELFNREAATFVGLYLVVDGLLSRHTSDAKRVSWGRVAVGIALCAISSLVTESLRSHLFIGTPRDAFERTIVLGQHWQVPLNLRNLAKPGLFKSYLIPFLVIGLSAVVWTRFRAARRPAAVPLGVLYGVLTVSLVLFAVLQETRVFIPYLPFLLLLRLDEEHVASLSRSRAAPGRGTIPAHAH